MKKNKLLLALPLLLLAGCKSPNPYGELGSGYVSDMDYRTGTSCLNGSVVFEGSPYGDMSLRMEQNRSQLKEHLNITSSGSYTFASGFKLSGSTDFSRQTEEDSYSLISTFRGYYVLKDAAFSPTAVNGSVLNDIGKSVLTDAGNFQNTCGNQFISKISLGGELYVAVKLSFASESKKQDFKTNVEGKWGDLASFSVSLKNNKESYKDVQKISIYAYQVGGDPSRLAGILLDRSGTFPAGNCTYANLNACIGTVTAVIDYAANKLPDQIRTGTGTTGPATMNLAFRAYENAGILPPQMPSKLTPEILYVRSALASQLDRQRSFQNRAAQLISESGNSNVVHPSYLQDVTNIKNTIDSNIQILMKAGLNCFSELTNCVSSGTSTLDTLPKFDTQPLTLGPRIPLHRYFNGMDHYFSTSFMANGQNGYTYEGIAGYVLKYGSAGTLPFLRYDQSNYVSHFYTTNYFELGSGCCGWVAMGNEGYLFQTAQPGTGPLYRYGINIAQAGAFHHYTMSYDELGAGKDGWKSEGIPGYLYSSWY